MGHCSLLTGKWYHTTKQSHSTFYWWHRYSTEPKKMGGDSTMKSGNTETMNQLSDRMISIKHCVMVILTSPFSSGLPDARTHHSSTVQRRCRISFAFANDSGQARGWNWIPMLFGLICDIYKVGIEMLASCESKWRLKGNVMDWGGKEVRRQEKRRAWWGHAGWTNRVQMLIEECGMKLKGANWSTQAKTGM